MLINRGLAKGTLTTFKLVTGDELLATVEDETTEAYKISRPVALVASQQGLAMVPFVMSVKDDEVFTLEKSKIVICAETREEVVAHYIKGTTGIETPK